MIADAELILEELERGAGRIYQNLQEIVDGEP